MQAREGDAVRPSGEPAVALAAPSVSEAPPPELDTKQLERLGIELAPTLLFLLALWKFGIFYATGVLMAGTVAALALIWFRHGRIAMVPLVSGGLGLVLGGITIYLQDPKFIQLKLTIVYALFAAILLYGLLAKKQLLKLVLGEAIALTDEGWRLLTWRWTGFFVSLALLNEVLRRIISIEAWGMFKFACVVMTLIFSVAQIGLIRRFALKQQPAESQSTAQGWSS